MGTAEDFFYRVFRNLFAVHKQRTATHVVKSTQARHNSVAQLVSLEITDRTYEDKLYLIDSQVPSGTTRKKFGRHCYADLCVE